MKYKIGDVYEDWENDVFVVVNISGVNVNCRYIKKVSESRVLSINYDSTRLNKNGAKIKYLYTNNKLIKVLFL